MHKLAVPILFVHSLDVLEKIWLNRKISRNFVAHFLKFTQFNIAKLRSHIKKAGDFVYVVALLIKRQYVLGFYKKMCRKDVRFKLFVAFFRHALGGRKVRIVVVVEVVPELMRKHHPLHRFVETSVVENKFFPDDVGVHAENICVHSKRKHCNFSWNQDVMRIAGAFLFYESIHVLINHPTFLHLFFFVHFRFCHIICFFNRIKCSFFVFKRHSAACKKSNNASYKRICFLSSFSAELLGCA